MRREGRDDAPGGLGRTGRDGHRLDVEAARRLLTQLKAEWWLVRIESPSPRAVDPAGAPLSERELQVLRLLAAGKTNRAIGDELFISEKTVARHVSNIFDKLGVSSRTAAASWAFHRHLI